MGGRRGGGREEPQESKQWKGLTTCEGQTVLLESRFAADMPKGWVFPKAKPMRTSYVRMEPHQKTAGGRGNSGGVCGGLGWLHRCNSLNHLEKSDKEEGSFLGHAFDVH